MGFRRNKSDTIKERRWREFIVRNQHIIEKSGIPESIVSIREMFDDFLMHGYIDHHYDPSRFTVDRLSNEEFIYCMELIERAIEEGFIRREELCSIKTILHSTFRPF